jgi:replicative DNA helicase
MEIIILKNLLTSRKFIKSFYKHIKVDYFSKENRTFVKSLMGFFAKHKTVPSQEILKSYVKENEKKDDDTENFEATLGNINKLILKDDYATIESTTIEWLEKKRTELGLIKIVNLIEKNDVAALQKEFQTLSRPITLNNTDEVKNLKDSSKQFFNDVDGKFTQFESGYQWFDWTTSGGWKPGTVNIFAGPSNIGKTLILLSLAVSSFNKQKNTLFVSYEIGKLAIQQKFYASLAGIDVNDIKDDKRNSQIKVEEILKDNPASIAVEYIPDGSYISDLENVLDEYTSKVNPNLEVLVLDYLTCIRSNLSSKEGGMYERYGDVIGELKRIAEKYGIAIITGAQVNRSGYNKNVDEMDISMLSDSMKITHKADNVYLLSTLFETDEKDLTIEKARVIEIKLYKGRDSAYIGAKQMFKLRLKKQRLVQMTQEDEQEFVKDNLDTITKNKKGKF